MNIKKFLKKLFISKKSYELEAVFTPASSADISYISRNDIEKKLIKALDIPGKQIVIYGHSGSGKTTILNHILNEKCSKKITTNCTNTSTLDTIILDAFDALNPYYMESNSTSKKESLSGNLTTEYVGIKGYINCHSECTSQLNNKRMLPPQLTMQRLAKFITDANVLWIIEDFHKVADDEKTKTSQMMKLFMDKAKPSSLSKIIVLGAAEHGYEVCKNDTELNNRVSEIEVPLLSDTEIMNIIKQGCDALNISISENVIQEIANYSNCLATIAHQLAYNICFNNSIHNTQKKLISIPDTALEAAITDFTSEKQDTYNNLYLTITKHRDRTYNNVEIILSALSSLSNDEISQHDILIKIQNDHVKYPQGNLSTYLKRLCSPELFEVLRKNSGRISFSDPFFKSYIKMREKQS